MMDSVSTMPFVFGFLLISGCLCASPQIPNSPQDETPATVYLEGGINVVGFSNFHNTRLVRLGPVKKANKVGASTLTDEMKRALSQKKARASAKKKSTAQGNGVKKIDFDFNNSPGGNSDFKQKSGMGSQAVISSFKFSKSAAFALEFQQPALIGIAPKKEKFHTSVFCIKFRRYGNSSLRAPPQYS